MNSKICVAVRKRPIADPSMDIVETPSPKIIVNEPKIKYDLTPYTDRHTFVYDEVFSDKVNNAYIYQKCCLPLLDTVFSNGNATCFAYGQTGSGKTHTMLGNSKEPGLYAIAAKEVFARADKIGAEVFVSFYEIYGRKIFDLLNNRERLYAREDGEKVINICGLSEHPVANIQEIFNVITSGSAYRAAGVTSANNESSRSHAVLQIEVRQKGNNGPRRNNTIGKISFIDLAGNERGADTFDCERKTRIEGAEINKSLLALKECIRALGMGKSHVPFRGSILTEVLRDSFTGNSRTTMIATISPSSSHCVNTLNTLRYTQRVKDLGGPDTNVRVEQVVPQQAGRGRGPAPRKPFLAQASPQPRPEWIDPTDDAMVPQSGGSDPEPEPERAVPVRSNPPMQRAAAQRGAASGAGGRRGGATEVKVRDPKIAKIVRNHMVALERSDDSGDDGSDSEASNQVAPQEEVRQVRKVHEYVVEEIAKAEEKLVAVHRRHIDLKMTGIKEEICAIQSFEDSEQVDEYVTKVRAQLEKQMTDMKKIMGLLSSISTMLKEEEDLSNTLTMSMRKANGRYWRWLKDDDEKDHGNAWCRRTLAYFFMMCLIICCKALHPLYYHMFFVRFTSAWRDASVAHEPSDFLLFQVNNKSKSKNEAEKPKTRLRKDPVLLMTSSTSQYSLSLHQTNCLPVWFSIDLPRRCVLVVVVLNLLCGCGTANEHGLQHAESERTLLFFSFLLLLRTNYPTPLSLSIYIYTCLSWAGVVAIDNFDDSSGVFEREKGPPPPPLLYYHFAASSSSASTLTVEGKGKEMALRVSNACCFLYPLNSLDIFCSLDHYLILFFIILFPSCLFCVSGLRCYDLRHNIEFKLIKVIIMKQICKECCNLWFWFRLKVVLLPGVDGAGPSPLSFALALPVFYNLVGDSRKKDINSKTCLYIYIYIYIYILFLCWAVCCQGPKDSHSAPPILYSDRITSPGISCCKYIFFLHLIHYYLCILAGWLVAYYLISSLRSFVLSSEKIIYRLVCCLFSSLECSSQLSPSFSVCGRSLGGIVRIGVVVHPSMFSCCRCSDEDVVEKATEEHVRRLRQKGLERCPAPELCVPVERRSKVRLNVYDLSRKNKMLKKVGFGIYHVGVVVFGIEWSFGEAVDARDGTGLFYCPPGCAGYVSCSVEVGDTTLSPTQVDTILHRLENEWQSRDYHILHRNCNHFAQRLCDLLSTVEPLKVPAWCNRAARMADTVVPRVVATKIQHKVSGGQGPPKSSPPRRTDRGLPQSVIPDGWYLNPSIVQPPKYRYNIGGVYTAWTEPNGQFSPTSNGETEEPEPDETLYTLPRAGTLTMDSSDTRVALHGRSGTYPGAQRVRWDDDFPEEEQDDSSVEREPHLHHSTGLHPVPGATPPSPPPEDASPLPPSPLEQQGETAIAAPPGEPSFSNIQSATLDTGSPVLLKEMEEEMELAGRSGTKYLDSASTEKSPARTRSKSKGRPSRRGRRLPKIRWRFGLSARKRGSTPLGMEKSQCDSLQKELERGKACKFFLSLCAPHLSLSPDLLFISFFLCAIFNGSSVVFTFFVVVRRLKSSSSNPLHYKPVARRKKKNKFKVGSFIFLNPCWLSRSTQNFVVGSFPMKVLSALFAYAVLLTAVVMEVAAQDPLYVLNLMSVKDEAGMYGTSNIPFLQGLKSVLLPSGSPAKGADSRTIELVEPENPDEDIATIIQKALAKNPSILSAVGPLSDRLLEKAVAYAQEHEPNLTFIGPYTLFLPVRTWNPQTYFIRSDPTAEIDAIVSHLVNSMHVKHIGVMHLSGSMGSARGYQEVLRALALVHQLTPVLYVQPAESSVLNETAFNDFASQDLQAIIIYAVSSDHTKAFVKRCFEDPRVSRVPLFFTSVSYGVMHVWREENPTTLVDFYYSSTNLLPTDTSFPHIQLCIQDLKNYIAVDKQYYSSYDDIANGVTGSLVVFGWLAGQILLKTLQLNDAVVNRETYQKLIFQEKSYVIESDIVVGAFAGSCGPYEILEHAICECNQGAHTVNVYSVKDFALDPSRVSTFGFPRDKCYASDYTLPFYGQTVVLHVPYGDEYTKAAWSIYTSIEKAAAQYNDDEVILGPALVDVSSRKALVEYSNHYLMDAIIGPMLDLETNAPHINTIVLDPFGRHPSPRVSDPNVLYLMPTMDQQIYLYVDMAATQDWPLAIVMRDSSYEAEIMQIIHNAAQVRGITVSVLTMEDKGNLPSTLAENLVLVIGLNANFLQRIRSNMEDNPERRFIVLYEEFALYYDTIMKLFKDETKEMYERLLTCSNLPMWNSLATTADDTYTVMPAYREAFDDSSELINPLSLQAWFATGVLEKIHSCEFGIGTLSMKNCIYRFTSYNFGGVYFGPFYWDDSCSGDNLSCRNFGATNLTVFSLSRVFDPTEAVLYGPTTPEMVYPPPSRFNLNMLLAAVVPGAVAFLVFVWLAMYICCWVRGRDNHAAPKNPNKPVTLLFSDIQSSTSLWAAYPEQMVEAMEAHHAIIRRELRKFECYEVKTIGDSFMIASENPLAIIKLAVSIQKALFQFNWETDCFDRFYVQSEWEKEQEEREAERPHFISPSSVGKDSAICTAEVSFPEDYKEMWNGLRVRIGIHTGMCDIRFDEVTKGFDYYGDTVNTAARTESTAIGGQILITKSTWDAVCAINGAEDLAALSVQDAGTHILRGVTHPMQMYQVDAIGEREFKKPVESSDSDEDLEDEENNTQNTTESRLKNFVAGTIYKVIDGVLSTFPLKKRFEHLRPIMAQWRVPSKCPKDDQGGFQALLLRFANRTSNIISQQVVLNTMTGRSASIDGSAMTKPRSAHSVLNALSTKNSVDAIVNPIGSRVRTPFEGMRSNRVNHFNASVASALLFSPEGSRVSYPERGAAREEFSSSCHHFSNSAHFLARAAHLHSVPPVPSPSRSTDVFPQPELTSRPSHFGEVGPTMNNCYVPSALTSTSKSEVSSSKKADSLNQKPLYHQHNASPPRSRTASPDQLRNPTVTSARYQGGRKPVIPTLNANTTDQAKDTISPLPQLSSIHSSSKPLSPMNPLAAVFLLPTSPNKEESPAPLPLPAPKEGIAVWYPTCNLESWNENAFETPWISLYICVIVVSESFCDSSFPQHPACMVMLETYNRMQLTIMGILFLISKVFFLFVCLFVFVIKDFFASS
eukprot:gene7387-5201_t